MLTKFGSHLYGTDTPESDTDYKGIYLPSAKAICLGKIPKSINLGTGQTPEKNTKEDVDCEIYSLHYFIELACKGETAALDMLHTNESCLEYSSTIWETIHDCRTTFYTKNLKAFVGYARKQAAKYGVKGSRLDAAKAFIEVCAQHTTGKTVPMSAIWRTLPLNEHAKMIENSPNGTKQYQLCGKIIQATMKISYAQSIIMTFHDKYGARAKLASENKGIDWKAMSHAIRAAVQVRQILREGTITFPLAQATLLKNVKMGELSFPLVLSYLEDMMTEVEELTATSTLRTKVNRKAWDAFICMVVKQEVFNNEKKLETI